MSLNISMEYPDDFCMIYNRFNASDKGRQLLQLSGISRDKLDIASMAKSYWTKLVADVSVDNNANIGNKRHINSFTSETGKGLHKLNGLYLMWDILKDMYSLEETNKLISLIIDGTLYKHDQTRTDIPYCVAVSCYNLIVDGRPYGQLQSKPPKRSDSFIAQCAEMTMDMSQQFAGAIGLGDILVCYTWFLHNELKKKGDPITLLKKDKEVRYNVVNTLQKFIFIVNNPMRVSFESPFTNISLYDRPTIQMVFGDLIFPDGKKATDLIEEIMEVQYIYMDFISKKDPISGGPYKFPIVTCNIYSNGDRDEEFIDSVAEHNREGLFNIYVTKDQAKIASCCRMVNDISQLLEYKGISSFGTGGISIGSHRVVTINLPRLGIMSGKDIDSFKLLLSNQVENAAKILYAHRKLIEKRIEQGYLEFFKSPTQWLSLPQMFYSTFGITGFWEVANILGIDIIGETEKAGELLEFLNKKVYEMTEKYEMACNLEQIPGESACATLAKKDRIRFGNIDSIPPIYSNQFVSLGADVDLYTRGCVDGKLQDLMSGGAICHLNVNSIPTKKQTRKLIDFAISTGLTHFALNPLFGLCENGHSTVLNGNSDICPSCGEKIIDKMTRIVGYFTKISAWSTDRTNELKTRTFHSLR